MKVYVMAFLLAGAASAFGQVAVEITLGQQQFLQAEDVPVAVRVFNRSGQTLHLGAEDDWITFTIESRDGWVVPKLSDVPVKGAFELESSHIATKRVEVGQHFAPMAPGHYTITATVLIREWNREISSAPTAFDVIDGTKLWEQVVGIPLPPGASNRPPELRRYVLQQANYLRGQIRLYLRVTDSYGKTLKVFPVGSMLSFSRPEPQVDKFSHLHVIYQSGPTSFSYMAYDLDGTLLARQIYEYQTTKPRLRMDDDGVVSVFGGVRRFTSLDVPPSAASDGLQPVTNSIPEAIGSSQP